MSKRRPENTSANHDPLAFLVEQMATGAAIERQEAQGQRSLVSSDTLPASMGPDGRAQLEAAGVKFGDSVEGGRLFVYAELPPGWQKRATDHSMWSELVDETGRVRASIFYKAAFYDRDAFMTVKP